MTNHQAAESESTEPAEGEPGATDDTTDTTSDDGPTGTVRLQQSGVGVIVGAIVLGGCSVVVSYRLAAAVVVLAGVVGWIGGRGYPIGGNVFGGIVAVGAIGLVEALTDIGFGLGPFALASVALFFGLADIIIGRVMDRFRRAGSS